MLCHYRFVTKSRVTAGRIFTERPLSRPLALRGGIDQPGAFVAIPINLAIRATAKPRTQRKGPHFSISNSGLNLDGGRTHG